LKKSDKVEELYSSNSEGRKIIQPDQRHADYSAPMIAGTVARDWLLYEFTTWRTEKKNI